ncbi:hypothetical protein C1X35_18960 [Pseudomonas sp. FW306-1C-G01A]|uniref:hypothetical protein n=1 Tax=unclassified Pseudomonas TaxID=196821 RepID=UPI000C86D12E|nr:MULTISPECIES: hypothetical protein [unclassified Pseudomonas]AVX93005.1 hypothetical protein PkP19E3_33070 [Pseudomonas koreensis]PMV86681.1 hypothetical protein C1X56_13610 [Pseudomonas sp. GW101-1A09]PMV94438.1 hypothetical protein C1X51_12260 [Pseudomonas sp. FW306-2-2C-B10A]PMW04336.1 hypothetical protein C1X50_17925 [Pseudomonas sp. MPR-TSA4]PMW11481.1 hypothetical protein C1X52_21280 [Pseudomonas sp. FW306-2-1A-C05A]
MRLIKSTFALVAFVLSTPVMAFAAPLDWQWNDPGSAGFYSGSIGLNAGAGASAFSRYDVGSTPNMTNDTVSTPPILLMAGGVDVDFSISNTGVAIAKKTCTPPAALEVYATPVTVCDSGTASNIQGFHVTATNTPTTFTPQLWIYVAGTGWKQVAVNNACGRLEVKQLCK